MGMGTLNSQYDCIDKQEVQKFGANEGSNTVDGRNPAPVDMVNISLFTGFPTCWVVSRISEPSTSTTRSTRNPKLQRECGHKKHAKTKHFSLTRKHPKSHIVDGVETRLTT